MAAHDDTGTILTERGQFVRGTIMEAPRTFGDGNASVVLHLGGTTLVQCEVWKDDKHPAESAVLVTDLLAHKTGDTITLRGSMRPRTEKRGPRFSVYAVCGG